MSRNKENRYKELENFINKLGLKLKNLENLDIALTHSSYVKENNLQDVEFNERLEFLGDSIIKSCSSEYLYKRFPNYSEGELSNIRSILVSDQQLEKYARTFNLGFYLKLGLNEENQGGRTRGSNLACAFEAFIGALYLDIGIKEVYDILKNFYINDVVEIEKNIVKYNAKAALQEYTQSIDKTLPEYKLVRTEGQPHQRVFTTEVYYQNKQLAIGTGLSKKESEQNAALQACIALGLYNDKK